MSRLVHVLLWLACHNVRNGEAEGAEEDRCTIYTTLDPHCILHHELSHSPLSFFHVPFSPRARIHRAQSG